MKYILHHLPLHLKHTFRISHESRTSQPTMILELTDENGITGFGESTLTRYYNLTKEGIEHSFEQVDSWLKALTWEHPSEVYRELEKRLPNDSSTRCMIDMAIHDIWAKRHGKPLFDMWELDPQDIPTTNYTIGIGPIEEMITKLREKPWPLYKIKLGTDQDLAILRALREKTDSIFRIDANTGWTAAQTIENIPHLADLGVEFVEQPLPASDWTGHQRVYEASTLPIIADESCHSIADIRRCPGHFHGINIKLIKCGGLTPALRMIEEARQQDLKVMMGCMTESSVGISAIAHIAPLLDYVDMDGAMLLSNDPADGVQFDSEGNLSFTGRNGIGARLL